MQLARILAAGSCVFMTFAATATGARLASTSEVATMAPGTGFSSACLAGKISTADPTWGDVHATNADGCPQADGLIVEHYLRNAWTIAIEGSDFGLCPLVQEPTEIPTDVALDLGLCARIARAAIICAHGGTGGTPATHPTSCESIPDALADAYHLTHLRWKHWGAPIATARGIDLGYHVPYVHLHVRITAYRKRRLCSDGDWVYTRIRETSTSEAFTQDVPVCA